LKNFESNVGIILTFFPLKPEAVFEDMPYFSFKGHYRLNSSSPSTVKLTDGTSVLVSRTGYTGEFGFEIFARIAPRAAQ